MTSPVIQGYPDFARRTPMADAVLVNDSQVNVQANVSYGRIYIANVPALWFHFNCAGDGFRPIFNWWTAPVGGSLFRQSIQKFPAGSLGNRSFRPFAPYLELLVQPTNLGGSYTALLTTMAEVHQPSLSNVYVNQISATNAVIGASASLTSPTNCVYVGKAIWSASGSGPNWFATLGTVDHNGAVNIIDGVGTNGGGGIPRPVYLGEGAQSITVTNADAAAAHFFSWYLNLDPDISS